MQNPVGAEFNFETMRMEMVSFAEVVLNPVAQVKFVHTVASGYTTGAMFVLGISGYYLLKGRYSFCSSFVCDSCILWYGVNSVRDCAW